MDNALRRGVAFLAAAACFVLVSGCMDSRVGEGKLTLAKDAVANYRIMADSADPVAVTAAKELAANLKAVTGAEFPVVKLEDAGKGPFIAVGPAAARKVMPAPALDYAKLGDDGIVLKSSGADIVLSGAEGAKRGTFYAVNEFLEGIIGVRWWTSTESFIPKRPCLEIAPLDKTYVPAFWSRELLYRDVRATQFSLVRNRINGEWERISKEFGGNCPILGHVHTFSQLLPPAKHFKAHPEWYSLIKGERSAKAQLCLTNDEMRKALTEEVLKLLRANPDARIVSVSQNDNTKPCQCAKCHAIAVREGSESGPVIEFVNKVAEDVGREFPDVYVDTLAYTYTRKAPLNVKPRANVLIRLCTIECSFSQTLSAGPQNEAFRKDIEAWRAIAPRLFIWDYVADFSNYIQPHPNLRVLGPNIRFFRDNNVVGLMEQGDTGSTCGDFSELKGWLLSHLMWNPDLDEKALMDEFMDGYYGPAAKPLREYLELTHDAVERSGVKLGCYMPGAPWFTLADLNKADALVSSAESVAQGDPVLSRRVRKVRIGLDYVWLCNWRWAGWSFAGNAAMPSYEEMRAKCARFNEMGVERKLIEREQAKSFKPMSLEDFSKSRPAPELCRELPRESWFDVGPQDVMSFFSTSWTMVDDPKAPCGKAMKVAGDHKDWAIQWQFMGTAQDAPVRYYVVARCEMDAGKERKGVAFKSGVYQYERPPRHGKGIGASEVADGEYHVFDMGVHDFSKGGYIWIAPDANPAVKNVYIERIFFVRESSKK